MKEDFGVNGPCTEKKKTCMCRVCRNERKDEIGRQLKKEKETAKAKTVEIFKQIEKEKMDRLIEEHIFDMLEEEQLEEVATPIFPQEVIEDWLDWLTTGFDSGVERDVA